ncbi:amino acid permease [Psittacicella hinzii]|uniref:Tyrosine-specific transport protein n=1 Tax=Psittacicella hinzii TaxID=2028575 RepID=A0A3A1YK13_9GAMM|nr:aromatic amino acid transport family protein [Psittacicella hinzii]RIY37538.1 hypothetical protein CKF58_04830 [Psittacicella hinzii]
MKSKVLGSMLLVAGTTIGAGMLAMPINTASVGFGVTFIELFAFFILMLIPALCIAEACQFAPQGTTVAGLMRRTFGIVGYASNTILLYVFAYSLASAYISAISSILAEILSVPDAFKKIFTVLCLIPLGLIAVISTKVADIINQIMFYIMCLAFVVVITLSVKNINLSYLMTGPVSTQAVVKSLPLFFLTYGFHILVPSLADYLDRDTKALKVALIGGLAIPFVIFTVWNLAVHGQIPQEDLIKYAQSNKVNIASYLNPESSTLQIFTTVFSLTALITSFIGLSTALITTLKETFAKDDNNIDKTSLIHATDDVKLETSLGRIAIFILAFALPAVLVTFTPKAFVFFLGFASIISTLQAMVMPMAAVIKIRRTNPELYSEKKVYRFMLPGFVIGLIAFAFLLIAFMADLNL